MNNDSTSKTEIPPPPPPPPYLKMVPISTIKRYYVEPLQCLCLGDPLTRLHYQIELEKQRQDSAEHKTVYNCFRSVNPILQEGPTCGMVALAMAINDQNYTPHHIQAIAETEGWTHSGEMFNCEWMAELARRSGKCHAVCIDDGIGKHLNCFVDCLRKGGSILVPYDKTQNHSPGLKGGIAAHWALITGFVIIKLSKVPKNGNLELMPCECSFALKKEPKKCFRVKGSTTEFGISLSDGDLKVYKIDDEEINEYVALYVCAYQGLSRHLQLWSFSRLAASNANLKTTNHPVGATVILPPGGIEYGLCNKAVLLYPL